MTLSILIPTYNDYCSTLVRELDRQAELISDMEYEIIIGDDGSTDSACIEEKMGLLELPHCRYVRSEENIGRARIRNLLAENAKKEWLLFIDGGHMSIQNPDYLINYFNCSNRQEVIYGGYELDKNCHQFAHSNLRIKYELQTSRNGSVDERNKHPYDDFHTPNFMIRREQFLRVRFDERFNRYGYEDVLFGIRLKEEGIGIYHFDNPTTFSSNDSNLTFLNKVIESAYTLRDFDKELRNHSRLLVTAHRIKSLGLSWLVKAVFKWRKDAWKNNLCSDNPSLHKLKLFKIGLMVSILN